MSTAEEDWAQLTRAQKLRIKNDWWIYPMRRWYTQIPMKIAFKLPRGIAYWAFIRVYAADGSSPGPEFDRVCKFWEGQSMWIKVGRPKMGKDCGV